MGGGTPRLALGRTAGRAAATTQGSRDVFKTGCSLPGGTSPIYFGFCHLVACVLVKIHHAWPCRLSVVVRCRAYYKLVVALLGQQLEPHLMPHECANRLVRRGGLYGRMAASRRRLAAAAFTLWVLGRAQRKTMLLDEPHESAFGLFVPWYDWRRATSTPPGF